MYGKSKKCMKTLTFTITHRSSQVMDHKINAEKTKLHFNKHVENDFIKQH